MRIIFMGTPDFAVPALRRLAEEHEIVCVYTKEPKISGRGNNVNKTPVHLMAESLGIAVRTPKTLKDAKEQDLFKRLQADAAVVAAYGLILPKEILEACPLGCLNLHASLLPKWRGAAPIQRCIEAGDKKSGITIMQIAEGLDTGDMLLQKTVEITAAMTGGELHDKLAEVGADLISAYLQDVKKYVPIAQDDSQACYAAKITKEECLLDFSQSAVQLQNKIRAFNPYPATYFEYEGERFKVLAADIVDENNAAGVIAEGEKSLIIGCQSQSLRITKIQRQGKRAMDIDELLRGFSFGKGTSLQS